MEYKLTSEFSAVDMVRNGVPHTGIDLAMPRGTFLRSVIDGWVSKVWDGSGTLGKGVTIKGLDGREYIYGHMDKVAMKVGDPVKLGSYIGNSGSTGRSTGPHLHFAVKENGQYIDPILYKPALDKLSGEMPVGPANTREELEQLQSEEACLNLREKGEDLSWYDVQGRMDNAFDVRVCEMKNDVHAFLNAIGETVVQLSYSVALLGGGILILFRVAGMTRAVKYFGVLQITHLLIRALFWEDFK